MASDFTYENLVNGLLRCLVRMEFKLGAPTAGNSGIGHLIEISKHIMPV